MVGPERAAVRFNTGDGAAGSVPAMANATGGWTREIVRSAYVPFMVLGVCGGAVGLIGHGWPGALALALVPVAIAASFGAEWLVPYQRDWNRQRGDSGRDVLHALVNETASVVTVSSVPLLAALAPYPAAWPRDWPFWVQVVFALLVLDFGITVTHRVSHRWSWLWRFHAVHHSVRRMYGFNGLMKHPVHQAIETAVGSAPLLLLGLPGDIALATAVCTAVALLLQHANVDYRLGPLRHVLATNHVHRFHHLRWPDRGDVNFGLFTTIWDRLLGTYHAADGTRFTSDDLGIAARLDYPAGYLAQLLEPFRAAPRTPTLDTAVDGAAR